MRTVFRPLVPRMEDGLRLIFERIPSSFVFAVLITFLLTPDVSGQAAGVSCYQRINVSINSGSSTRLRISQLTPRAINPGDTVLLEDRTELLFTCEDVGQIITATLMDAMGEMCTVDIHVENKSPLDITCRDTSINCIDDISSIVPASLIDVVSSCDDLTGASVAFVDEAAIPFPAESDTLESILRNYTVVSASGDTARCMSQIFIERFDLSTIIFPPDITISCGSDPADTSITGGLNVDPNLLGDLCNVAATASDIDERDKGSCQNPRVYERIWAVTDWATDEMRTVTQLISVLDENVYQIEAPSSFEMIPSGCKVGIVLDTAVITTICLEFGQEDIEILLDGGVHAVGDTVSVKPGTYSIIYQARSGCINVLSDTANVEVSDDSIVPLQLDCTTLDSKCVVIRDDMPLQVAIDTFCSSAIFQSCGDAVLRARKVNNTCTSNTDVFQDILEFCPEDLPSGQTSGTIFIEVAAVVHDTMISNICTIEVEIKEDVAPLLIAVDDPTITLGPDGTFTLDTSILVDVLMDESDCILSLAMTGSGTGFANTMIPTGSGAAFASALALTGSGIPFFADGEFFSFTCQDTGTYDVFLVAEDCSNNLAFDTTSLTVLPGAGCEAETMSRMISGSVASAYGFPLFEINVDLITNSHAASTLTSLDGTFQFRDVSDTGEIMIRHNDSWLNGISVIDLRLLQNHIIGLMDFEDWQKAAADVDGSGRITSKDLLMAKLILLDRDAPRSDDEMPWLFSIDEEVPDYQEYLTIKVDPSEHTFISATKKGDINGDAITSAENRSHKSLPIYAQSIDEHHTRYTIDEGQDIFQISLDIKNGTLMTMSHLDQYVFGSGTSLDILKYEVDYPGDAISFVIKHNANTTPSIAVADRLNAISYNQSGVKSSLGLIIYSDIILSKEEVLSVLAFPNPSNGDVWIDLVTPYEDGSDVRITLTDMQGRLISQRAWSAVDAGDIFPYRLPDIPHAGMYIAHVRFKDRTETLHIVKK